MLTLHDLAPLLDVALTQNGLRDPEQVTTMLAMNHWVPGPAEHNGTEEERHWRAAEVPAASPLGASVWTSSSLSSGLRLGFVVEASSADEAEALRDAIRDRIVAERRFAPVASDQLWSNWSDGDYTVYLAALEGSTEPGKDIPWTVQVSFEPATPGQREN
jgi:hypothetical protein